jgi:hypothetical protein
LTEEKKKGSDYEGQRISSEDVEDEKKKKKKR